MIHAKYLLNRLAWVPLMLAVGLVFGVGEVAAQVTGITTDTPRIRENADRTEVKLTVAITKKDTAQYLSVSLVVADDINGNATLEAPGTVLVAADAESVEVTAYIDPIPETDAANVLDSPVNVTASLVNKTTGAAVGTFTETGLITLVDISKATANVTLSLSPSEADKDDGPTTVTVTATVDGETFPDARSFFLNAVTATEGEINGNDNDNAVFDDDGSQIIPAGQMEVVRDTDYDLSGAGKITIPADAVSGTATFTVDPKAGDTGAFLIGKSLLDLSEDGDDASPDAGSAPSVLQFTYLRAHTDSGDPFDQDGRDIRYDDTDANFVEPSDQTDPNYNVLVAADQLVEDTRVEATVSVGKGVFTITDQTDPTAGSDQLSISPSAMIREESGTNTLTLTISTKDDVPARVDTPVKFTLTDGDGASRDVNYTAELAGNTVILAGGTSATTTLTITPINDEAGGNKVINVAFEGSGISGSKSITITDDDTDTSVITLSADPASILEDAGETDVTITATLAGKVLDEDATLNLRLATTADNPAEGDAIIVNPATRDIDYTAVIRSLTIPAGSITGSTTISITPVNDGANDGSDATLNEKVYIIPNNTIKNQGDADITIAVVAVELTDTGVMAIPEDPDDTTPSFTEEDIAASSTVIEGTAGAALSHELPEAMGDGDLSYVVAGLPAGLSFDAATRTISGTPAAAGSASIVYTVLDGDMGEFLPSESAALTYLIEIDAMPAPVTGVASIASTISSVREDGAAVEAILTVTLASAPASDEKVEVTITAPSLGTPAVRDVDYSASLSATIEIAAGETEGSTTLILAPIDNSDQDGNRAIGLRAAASGGSATTDITIADDETPSSAISLTVSPHTVSESDGVTELTVTATLNGGTLDAEGSVHISIDVGSAATRDVDYTALFNPTIKIDAGAISGSTSFLIDPTDDEEEEGSETITVNGLMAGLAGGSTHITISNVSADDKMMEPLALGAVDDMAFTAGTAIDAMELPASTGGDDMSMATYSVEGLPAGLSFDAESRTISGTPEAEGTAEVTYTATDASGDASVTFTITVNPPPAFAEDDFLGMFDAFGAGKANPAAELGEDGVLLFTAGVPESFTMPPFSGGTPPLTYALEGLPAGLSFDPATRIVSGTATELSEPMLVTYMVTDANGAPASLPFLVAVINPPLDAPDNLVAEDYRGADGQGDQGGFVLLSWDLSEHHDGIDGYRIFRALPVLGNEMMPWAMVDAVPGVEMGRAIVATLDNVSTRWGIAAERGGQTTHGEAKAVFVSGDNPYELIAETMQASRAAAVAGDAPVFASLLPEALAYAQGVAPKLNFASGVQSSALTITEEAVRAIDNIAPLAVSSLNVLDAPGDAGSRIAVEWGAVAFGPGLAGRGGRGHWSGRDRARGRRPWLQHLSSGCGRRRVRLGRAG